MDGTLPDPRRLAALGTVLCLYRVQSGSELAGWSQAARAVCHSWVDSDGLSESVLFYDHDGACCWRLCLLPDTDFLAWEQLVADLPRSGKPEPGSELAERLWRQVARRLRGPAWRANVVRLHALTAGPGFTGHSLLAASLPRLSACGAEVARRVVRDEGIECDALIDECCCRRAANRSPMAVAFGDDRPALVGFNTRMTA